MRLHLGSWVSSTEKIPVTNNKKISNSIFPTMAPQLLFYYSSSPSAPGYKSALKHVPNAFTNPSIQLVEACITDVACSNSRRVKLLWWSASGARNRSPNRHQYPIQTPWKEHLTNTFLKMDPWLCFYLSLGLCQVNASQEVLEVLVALLRPWWKICLGSSWPSWGSWSRICSFFGFQQIIAISMVPVLLWHVVQLSNKTLDR